MAWEGMWSLHYNPYRTMSAKKNPPVTHNAEREMANMQQKYNDPAGKRSSAQLNAFKKKKKKIVRFILKSPC